MHVHNAVTTFCLHVLMQTTQHRMILAGKENDEVVVGGICQTTHSVRQQSMLSEHLVDGSSTSHLTAKNVKRAFPIEMSSSGHSDLAHNSFTRSQNAQFVHSVQGLSYL